MTTENSNSSNTKDVVDAVTGLAKAIPVYEDAIRPAAKEVGKGLETVAKTVNIALAPVTALIWGYDQIESYISKRVSEKLKNIPKEKIITPNISVAGPTLEALRFAGHEENLREMYANLLATAMNSEVSDLAHPSFVEIIKQLAPEEAKFVKILSKKILYPFVLGVTQYSSNEFSLFNFKESDIPSIEFHLIEFGKKHAIESHMIKIYFSNLLRLRILEIKNNVEVHEDTSNYTSSSIEDDDFSSAPVIEQEISTDLSFSHFGQTFVRACVK